MELLPAAARAALDTHRPIASWAINARPHPAELQRQLADFQRLGYGGVMLIPWGDLPCDFMDDAWLAAVGVVLKAARERGMLVFIWDDWIFPSGFAGGRIAEHDPALRSSKLARPIDLVLEAGEGIELPLPARTLSAAIVPVDKFNNADGAWQPLPIDGGRCAVPAAASRRRLIVVAWDYVSALTHTVVSHARRGAESGPAIDIYSDDDRTTWSADLLNPRTAELYLALIHERYAESFPEHLGTTLRGFFYDEPGLPSQWVWSPVLAAEFRRRKGYDLVPELPAVLTGYTILDVPFDLQPERLKPIIADYREVYTSLLAENFFRPLQRWCHERGLICTGHLGNDDSIAKIVSTNGHYFKTMQYNDWPGVDVVFEHVVPGRFTDHPRLAASAAHLHGREHAISESFAVTGQSLEPRDMRYIMEHQLVRGITRFFPKILNYDAESTWHFHPPDLTPLHPLIATFGDQVNAWMTRLGALLSSGEPPEALLVLVPEAPFYADNPAVGEALMALAEQLIRRRWPFDYACPFHLAELTARDGALVAADGRSYRGLIVPEGFEVPTELALPEGFVRDLESLPEPAEIVRVGACEALVHVATRRFPDRQILFVLNESTQPATLPLQVEDGWRLGLFIPHLDTVTALPEPRLTLPPEAGRLLVAVPAEVPLESTPKLGTPLPLTDWCLSLDGGSASAPLPCADAGSLCAAGTPLRYETTFAWSGGPARLELGALWSAAVVYLDGERVARLPWPPFVCVLAELPAGEHALTIEVWLSPAHGIFGAPGRYEELQASGAFNGSYLPIHEALDRRRIARGAGLHGPVNLYPMPA